MMDSLTAPNFKIRGKEEMKMVFAGVGTPMNELVCLVSILNLANRTAEKTVMRNPVELAMNL